MKISYIHIENFKGIENLLLSDISSLNVIAGVNGSGKTSILTAIKILLSWLIARIRNPKGMGQKIQDKDITVGKPYCLLEIALDNGVRWSLYKQRSNVRIHVAAKTDMAEMSILANNIAEVEAKDGDITLIAAYGVNRVVNETPMRVRKPHRLSALDAMTIDMSNSVNFHDFFIWFREIEDIENEKMRETGCLVPDKSLQAVRSAISELFEGYTDFKVQRSPKAFIIKKDNIKLDFNQLSDGEKSYIALILDIARKLSMTHPSLANPLQGDGIILIDEIDLHLHPSWQISVIEKLQRIFPNCQFFITTHSPHVVSCVNLKAGDHLIVVSNGKVLEGIENNYGRETNFVLSDIFQLDNLRNPVVQKHIDAVWGCLRNKDYQSDLFNTEMEWLKANVDKADSIFAQFNLQIALIKKGL